MKTWRMALAGAVLLPLSVACNAGVSPTEPLSTPRGPDFATNVDPLLVVDAADYIEQDNALELVVIANRGLLSAGYSDPEFVVELDLSNVDGQTKNLQITQAAIKPPTPPTHGLVVIAIVVPWDGKDADGDLMTGATMVEYNVEFIFTDKFGHSHRLAVASGDVNIIIGTGP